MEAAGFDLMLGEGRWWEPPSEPFPGVAGGLGPLGGSVGAMGGGESHSGGDERAHGDDHGWMDG